MYQHDLGPPESSGVSFLSILFSRGIRTKVGTCSCYETFE
jgi:hypothetical protein